MTSNSISSSPPTRQPQQAPLPTAVDALRDLIEFAEQQHQPCPCIGCEGKGIVYDVFAPNGEEDQLCRACGGTGTVFPIVNPLVNLGNIAAAKQLLSDLTRQSSAKAALRHVEAEMSGLLTDITGGPRK